VAKKLMRICGTTPPHPGPGKKKREKKKKGRKTVIPQLEGDHSWFSNIQEPFLARTQPM